jgi:hypothetical protein
MDSVIYTLNSNDDNDSYRMYGAERVRMTP